MWKVCLQTFRSNKICWKLAYFLRNLLHGQITREFLGLRMRHFHGIAFIWTRTFTKVLKSALVYL